MDEFYFPALEFKPGTIQDSSNVLKHIDNGTFDSSTGWYKLTYN